MSSVPLPWWTSKSIDRDALDAVRLERVRGADGDVVEEAEAHRPIALGVVPGRPDRAERTLALAPHHEVGGEHDGAGGVLCRRQRVRVERGVGVDEVQPCRGARLLEGIDVRVAVHAGDLRARRRQRRVVAQVGVEPGGDQAVADGVQPVGALGMVRPHVVQQRGRVGDVGGGHGAGGDSGAIGDGGWTVATACEPDGGIGADRAAPAAATVRPAKWSVASACR